MEREREREIEGERGESKGEREAIASECIRLKQKKENQLNVLWYSLCRY